MLSSIFIYHLNLHEHTKRRESNIMRKKMYICGEKKM